jgi:hypothetical protein
LAGKKRVTLAADNEYYTRGIMERMRSMNVTPDVARNKNRNGVSAMDGRTAQHDGYKESQGERRVNRPSVHPDEDGAHASQDTASEIPHGSVSLHFRGAG